MQRKTLVETRSIPLLRVRWSSRLPQMLMVKIVNQFLHIPEMLRRLPVSLYVTVTRPLYEILELLAASCRVEDLVNLLFIRVIQNCQLVFGWRLACCRRWIEVEQRDEANVLLPDRIWKVYIVMILIDDLTYHVWSCPFVIQFLGQSCCLDVPCWKLDFISDRHNNVFASAIFGWIGMCLLQVLSQGLVSLLQASCKSVSLHFPLQARWLLRGLTLHHQMVVWIIPEWDPHSGRVYLIIIFEFG